MRILTAEARVDRGLPLCGYRGWALDPETHTLISPQRGTRWDGPVLRAEAWSCAGAVRDECGVHLGWSIADALEYVGRSATLAALAGNGRVRPHVLGRARVVPGSERVVGIDGLRAEAVIVDRLWVDADTATCTHLGRRYGVVAAPMPVRWTRHHCDTRCDRGVVRTAVGGYEAWHGVGGTLVRVGVSPTYGHAVASICRAIRRWCPWHRVVQIARGPMCAADWPSERSTSSWDLPIWTTSRPGRPPEHCPDPLPWDDAASRDAHRRRSVRAADRAGS